MKAILAALALAVGMSACTKDEPKAVEPVAAPAPEAAPAPAPTPAPEAAPAPAAKPATVAAPAKKKKWKKPQAKKHTDCKCDKCPVDAAPAK